MTTRRVCLSTGVLLVSTGGTRAAACVASATTAFFPFGSTTDVVTSIWGYCRWRFASDGSLARSTAKKKRERVVLTLRDGRVPLHHEVLVRRMECAAALQEDGPPFGPIVVLDEGRDGREHKFVFLEIAPRPHLDGRAALDDEDVRFRAVLGDGRGQQVHGRGRPMLRDGHLHALIEVQVG